MKEYLLKRKKVIAGCMALLMLVTACLPNIINAIQLADAHWNDPLIALSWESGLAEK